MTRAARTLPWLLAGSLLLAGVLLLGLALLPYPQMKTLFDGLAGDSEFEALQPSNLGVFRTLFLAGGLSFFVLAGATLTRGWKRIGLFLGCLYQDAAQSLRALRPSRKNLPFLAAVLVITGAAAVLRLEYLQSPMHHDEAYTYMAFGRSLRAALTDYHLPNNHVFHTVLVHFSTRLLGSQPWVVRLPAFTAGVLLVPAVIALGRRIYSRWVGLGAGVLVALSPALVNYSTNARGYTLVALLGVLLLILGHAVLQGRNRFAWGLIVLVSALGMFTLPVFLFPFGILHAWLLLEIRSGCPPGYLSRPDFLKYWLFSGLASAVVTLCLYLPILVYSGPGTLFGNDFISPLPWWNFPATLARRLAETWQEWSFRVHPVVLFLLALGFVLGLLLHRKLFATHVPIQAAAALWIAFLLIAQRPNAWAKIWVFLLPLVILWSVAGLLGPAGLLHIRHLPVPALAAGCLGLYLLARAAWLLPQLPGLWKLRGDEENAVLIVGDRQEQGDRLVVSPPDDAAAWYYAELHGMPALVYRADGDYDRLFVLVDPQAGQSAASVLDDRGPGQGAVSTCGLLGTTGRIQIYECQEAP